MRTEDETYWPITEIYHIITELNYFVRGAHRVEHSHTTDES